MAVGNSSITTNARVCALPPNKRSRCEGSVMAKLIDSFDDQALFDALGKLLLLQRPDLLERLSALRTDYLDTVRWPTSQLNGPLQKLAADGIIELDPESNRWIIRNLTSLIPPKKDPSRAGYTRPPLEPRTSTEAQNWIAKLKTIPVGMGLGSSPCWHGVLARNDKKRTDVNLTNICSDVCLYLQAMRGVMSISLRSPYDEMLKKTFVALGYLQADTPDSAKIFQEYKAYFQEKNRAGVVRVPDDQSAMIYILPMTVPGVTDALRWVRFDPSRDDILIIVVAQTNTTLI